MIGNSAILPCIAGEGDHAQHGGGGEIARLAVKFGAGRREGIWSVAAVVAPSTTAWSPSPAAQGRIEY